MNNKRQIKLRIKTVTEKQKKSTIDQKAYVLNSKLVKIRLTIGLTEVGIMFAKNLKFVMEFQLNSSVDVYNIKSNEV